MGTGAYLYTATRSTMQTRWVQALTCRGCCCLLPLCWWCPLVCLCLLEEGVLIVVCQEDSVQDQLAQAGRQVLLLEQVHHWPVIKGVLQAERVDWDAAQTLAAAPLAIHHRRLASSQGGLR